MTGLTPVYSWGKKEMCNCRREHVNTHKLCIINSLVYLRHLLVCVCVYVAQFSASFQEYHIRQEDVIL